MAVAEQFPIDKPGISVPQLAESTVSPCGAVSIPQEFFETLTPYQNYKVAFIGQAGCGRNSLAWRLNNLDDSDLPAVPFLPYRQVVLETSTRPALRHQGVVAMTIRIMPPYDLGDGQLFFDKRGAINEYDALVFIFDLGNEKSSDEFYKLHKKAKESTRGEMKPFLLVGNKVDLRLFGVVTPHRWGENTATLYSARAYLECSAKCNDRVGDVLDALLKILL